jgi:hypothetical protein
MNPVKKEMREAFDTVICLRHCLLPARRLVVIALADCVLNVFWLGHEDTHPEYLSTCVAWLQAALSCLAHLQL